MSSVHLSLVHLSLVHLSLVCKSPLENYTSRANKSLPLDWPQTPITFTYIIHSSVRNYISLPLDWPQTVYSRPIDLVRTYSPFPRRWDSKCSAKCASKSLMVEIQVSFQMRHLKRDLRWPSRISFCIPRSISSLIFAGAGCTIDSWLTTHSIVYSRIID